MLQLVDFDSLASKYIDKQVEINGIVDHVCKHSGKKLFIVNKEGTADVHVTSDIRFNDSLVGNEVTVIGIVREFKVDEAYCQQLENDAQKTHSNAEDNKEVMEQNKQQSKFYRDSMKQTGVDHLSFYSIEFVAFK